MSSKITNAGGDPSKRQPNETSNPRGPPTNGTQKTTNGYGKSRGENDSYYGTSTPPHPMAATDTSMYTGVGGSGMYNPAFAPLSSYLSQPTTSPMPPSPSTYNPVLVPQDNPFYPSVASAMVPSSALVATNPNNHAQQPNIQAPQPPNQFYHSHDAVSTSHPVFAGGEAASYYESPSEPHTHNHNHNHDHNPPPPLRQSFKKLWENLCAEERHAVGQFELYSEIEGVCDQCFTPGTSYTQAPRAHHYGQRWSKSKGAWRVRRSNRRRVWMAIFRKGDPSGSSCTSSSSSSSSSSNSSDSDSGVSATTARRRKLNKQIERERKKLEQQERRELCQQRGHTRNCRCSSTQRVLGTSCKHVSAASTTDITSDSLTKTTVFHDSGYGPGGKACPKCYSEGTNRNKSSGFIMGSWLESSKNGTTSRKNSGHTRTTSQVSVASSSASTGPHLFEVPSSASPSDDGLIYDSSSSSSLGSRRKTGWFFHSMSRSKSKPKKKNKGKGKNNKSSSSLSSSSSPCSSTPSEDGLIYGSGKETSVDSASIRSNKSYAVSTTSSLKSAGSRVFGVQRRRSWDDIGTPSNTKRNTDGAAVGFKRSNSTGYSIWGRRSETTTKTAASTQGGWFSGGGRKAGGWFGGAETATTRTSRSQSLSSRGSSEGWQEGVETAIKKEPWVYGNQAAMNATQSTSAISSTLVGTQSDTSTHIEKSYSTTDITSRREKAREPSTDGQVFITLPSGERRSTKEVWVDDRKSRDKRSPEQGAKRTSSVDSWKSFEPRSQHHSRSDSHSQVRVQKTATQTAKSNFFSSLLAGRSETFSERSKKETKKAEEAKKSKVLVRDGKITKGKSRSSSVTVPPEEPITLTKVYPMATKDPERFDTIQSSSETDVTRRETNTSSFVRDSYSSKQHEASSSYTMFDGKGASIIVGGSKSTDQRRPLPVPIQAAAPPPITHTPDTASITPNITPISTTIINTTIHHTTNTSNTNNNNSSSTSYVNIGSSPVTVLPVHSVSSGFVEHSQSHSNAKGYSASLVQDIAAATATQVAAMHAKDRAEHEEREKLEIMNRERHYNIERERSEQIQRELAELREREEKAALLHKEKSDREERERRALRLAIEQKEKEEVELKLKREREERAAIELKRKLEWEAREKAEDDAARLSRQKQDEERLAKIKSMAEKEYREWCSQQTLQRLQREKENDEFFRKTKKELEERSRELEKQAATQKAVEEAWAVEVEKKHILERELQVSKDEEKKRELRRVDISNKLEEKVTEVQRLQEEKAHMAEKKDALASQQQGSFIAGAELQQKKDAYDHTAIQGQKSSLEVQRMEFLKEQDRIAQAAKALEETRRVRFELEVHGNRHEQRTIETQRTEVAQEHQRTVEKLSKLEQVAIEAHRSKDQSKVREVQHQIQVEQEKETRLRIEEEKKATAINELKKQEDLRVQSLELQIADEKKRDQAALIEGQRIVAAEMEAKKLQQEKKIQQLESLICAGKEKEDQLKMEEGQRVLDQMEQTRIKDERAREYIAQVRVEEEKSMQVQIEKQKTSQAESEFVRKQEEAQDFIRHAASEAARIEMRKADQEKGQVETRRETRTRIETERSIEAIEEKRREERAAQEEVLDLEDQDREILTEEEQIIRAEVQRRWENEKKQQKRSELEKEVANLQRQIAEKEERDKVEREKREKRRARSREKRAQPGYQEREARRSRERSKKRDSQAAVARREEIEFVREQAGLDKTGEKEKKKRAYSPWDPLPNGDIPGFAERKWSIQNGVPRLIETPPTPPPGTPRFPQRVHCEGSYFPPIDTQTDPSIPVVPALPSVYAAQPAVISPTSEEFEKISRPESASRPQVITETSAEFEKRVSGAESRTEVSRSLTSSETQTTIDAARKVERSITSSEFEETIGKSSDIDVRRVEPVRAVTSSETENISGTAVGSQIINQSVASTEGTKASGYGWGSIGNFGSGLMKAATSVISETPSFVGNSFTGTPAAPVPTVPNLGSAVINYQQKDDSEQQELHGDSQAQEQVYQGPQSLPSPSDTPAKIADVNYGPELPPYLINEASSAMIQSNKSTSQSQSNYQQASSDYSIQQITKPMFSEVVYGPILPPNYPETQSSQDSKDAWHQSIYDQMSSDYIRSKESSDVEYGPVSLPVSHATGEFRLPGAFDDEEVAPDVLVPQAPRDEKTSANPIYRESLSNESHSLSESVIRNHSESTSREASSFSQEVEFGGRQISYQGDQTLPESTNRPVILGENRSVSEYTRDNSTESASKSASSITQETRVDMRNISHENNSPAATSHRPALATGSRSMSESSKNIYSSESTSRLASSFSREIDSKEGSQEDQISSAQINRPALESGKRAFSESASTLYSADSDTRSTSTISRDQFQTPPISRSNESTPTQDVSGYRQRSSPPNVFAFEDNEASSTQTAAIGTGRSVSDDGKRLTREKKDQENELMAIATASAESAGFDPGLILGNIQPHRLSTVIEAGETTPSTTTGRRPSIARPRSAFIEEVEDEDNRRAKRQLGQHEFSAEAYLSHAEILAREEARSRSEQQLASGSRATSPNQDVPPLQPLRPNPAYSSTPEGSEFKPEYAPPPQPTDLPVDPVELPQAHSAPPSEVIQERKTRAHGVTRSVPASRSASVSGSLGSMDSVREEEGTKRPSTSRSSSLSGFFRRKKKDDTPSLADSGVGFDTDDGTRRGRVPRSEEEETQESGGSRGRRERSSGPRLQRQATEQPSQSLPRRSTDQWDRHAAEDQQNLPRRSTDSVVTTHESQSHENEPQSSERHSRRSIDSAFRHQEGIRAPDAADIDEEEGSKAETESLHKSRSKMKKVANVGKMFAWANRSKREKSSSRSREASQTRGESVRPTHKRSVSEASGRDKPGVPGHNTEESGQFTPPQKSRTSSLRDVDMGSNYEIVEGESYAPTPSRDEPEPYVIDEASLAQRIEATMAKASQHAETKSLHYESTPVESAETPERPKSERKLSTAGGLAGVFKAARRLKRSTTTPQIPTHTERPGELTRADTDSKLSHPSFSSGGASLYDQQHTESGSAHSLQGNEEGQRVARDVSLPSSTSEESRTPLASARSGSLKRKSTKSLRSLSEAQAGNVAQSQTAESTGDGRESDSNTHLPRRSNSTERKVKETANSHAHIHDGEPVAKSYNYVKKSTSAKMLTRSEGVDLSSDFRGQHENTQSFSEPQDIFDDRDSPPFSETLPIESSSNSPLHSSTQQHIPNTFSFASRTPSPISESAAVDIYEEYPALPQSNSSSPYNLSPINQNIASEQLPVHDEEIPDLPFGGPPYVQTRAAGTSQPQLENQTQSPFMNFFQSAFDNFPVNTTKSPSWTQLPKAFTEERSISPKDVSVSVPITGTNLPPTSLGDSSDNGILETLRSPQLSAYELQSPSLEVLKDEAAQFQDEQRPVDTIFEMLENLPPLPESPTEEFGQPIEEFPSTYDVENGLHGHAPSEPEVQYNVQEQIETNSDRSPPHPSDIALESSSRVPENEPHIHPSQAENKMQPQLPPLKTEFEFPDMNGLPQLPPSSSSLVSLDWVSAGPPSEHDPASVDLEETFISHFLSHDISPTSPVVVTSMASRSGSDTNPPSQPASPISQSEIERNESTIGNIPLHSRSPSTQPHVSDTPDDFNLGDFTSTHTVGLLECPTTTYLSFEESVRPVDSAPLSTVAEDMFCKSEPASPVLGTAADKTLQVYEPENGSSCDLPEQIYEIPDIPDREYTSLSPIFEESSVSAVSRAASAMADDFSRPASPEVSRVAPVERPQSQYNDPFASKDYEGAASTGAVLSTIEEKIPEGHPQESRPATLEPIFDDQQSEAQLPPVEYESQSEAHTISSELVATELESENLSLSQDKLFPTREPAFMPIENNLELGGQESEQTNEGVSHHESDIQIGPINSHVVGLPPTNEDIFLEAASIPLPEDEETWDCLTDSSVEPIVGVREPNIEQPVEEQTLAYTLPTNIDSEGSSHHSSFVEASFETPETISVVVEPENAPLPKDSPVLMPEEPEMTTETEVVEEHATSQTLETIEFEGLKQEKTPEFSPEDIAPEYAIETETESRRNSEIAFELSPIMETEEEPDLENLPKFEGLPASEPEPRMVETFEDSNPEPGNLLRDESSVPSEPEHTVTRILEQCQEEFLAKDPPEGNASSDNTIQVESERPPMAGRDFDGKPVSPIPESSKDIGPEVSELPDEGLISPPSSTGEPITAAELAEITSERHSDSNQPDHKPLEEPEIESIIRRFSVEGTQISPLFMNDGEGSASEITPSENTLTILPSIPVEPMNTNETQTATESATQDAYEPITEGQQIEEQPIHQQRYGTPPPLEVESMIPSTQFEFSENIGIQETKIENDTRIDDQEEEDEEEGNGVKAKKGEVRGEGYDGVKEQIGTEITEDLVQIYAEPITFGTGVESLRDSLTQADTQEPDNISEETEDIGSDAWEEGVKLETSFEVEQEFVPILREEDAAQTDHQDLVTLDYIVPQSEQSPTAGQPISPDGQNMFDYVSSIMGSTPLNYSTNLQTGHMIDSDAESQNGASILKSGKEQDEAALERPTAVEQESVFEKPSSDKEGGKEQTENDYSQDDENFSAEREFTIEPPVQEIQPGSQLDAHPVEPALTLDTEPTLKETIAFEPETHEDIYLEGEHTTQENREVKSLAKNGDGPAEGKRANPQGFNLSQPASPWLEGFVDIFNLPSPQRTAVDNTIRPLEEEPILDNDHTVEDAEYEEFKEASGRPGISVSAPSSPKFPQILVESEAPSPSLEPALPEHTESLTIHSAMQDERSLDDAKEVGKGDGLENHSLEQSESFLDLSALSPSEEPAAITESYSSKLDIEVADAGIIEPELHINAPETAAEFTVLPQESKIEENAYAPEEDRVPIKNDNVTTTEALPLSTPNFRVEQIERIAGVEQRSIHLEGEDSVKQPSVEVEASGKPYSVQEPTHEFVQSSQMAGFQPTELSRPASPVNVAEKIRKESEEQGQLQESLIHDLKEEKPSAEASQSPVIASVSIPEIEVQQSEFLLLNEKDIQENRPLMDNAEDILLNVNQGKKEYQIPPPTLESLDSSYQIPEGLIEHIPTPVTAKAKSRDIPSGSTEEVPLSTKAREDTLSPQKENNIQQSEVVQGQVMGHESVPMETSLSVASVPMTPTLSEVNKRRSKKARQREKKRKSLQGVDISGSSVASAEKPVTPSLGEFPSGVPILEAIPTENGPLITKTQPATPVVSPKKNTGSEIIGNVEHRENDQVAESMSEKIKQEDKLPEADRQDDTLDQFTYDHHENPITDKSNSTSSIGTTGLDGPNQDGSETAESPVARRESSIYTQGTTKPVEEPAASQFPAALDISAPTVQPESDVPEEGVKGRLGSVSLVSPPPLTHQLTPSSPSLTTPALHVGDSLGFSPKPDLRPSTPRAPQIIVDSIDSPNGPDVLPFPERRSPKVDVAHLRLPSNIPRDPSLPRILRQGSSENQSTGDVLLSEPQNFASPDPPAISTTTHNISTPSTRIYDDPEDEDPSSSFGDGELQGIPAAQVGLRSPMSVSGSKPLSFFRANVQSQRHPSQDIGIDGVTPIVKESKNLQLAPSPSFEEANKGKDGEEEEGIEFGGDHGSRDTTVITAIANEAAQSDNNEISTTNIIPQFFAKSKEAESVSKPESTSTYHTVNAEDLLSQTITNNLNPSIVFLTTQSPDLPIENYTTVETLSGGQTKSSPTVTPQKTLSPEQAPHLSRTNSTESSSTSEGVSLQPPSTSPVLENLPQIIQESPKPPPPEAGNQDEDTHIPPSEASLTPPPPLTHSSSFESTIEFWKRRSLLSTTGSIPTPQLSPYAESGASLPISFLPKSRGSSSVWPRSPVEQTSEPLNTKAKEISVNTIKATPPQAPLESRVENENLKDKVTDQSYQVSVRQGSDKNKAQVEIDLQAPVSLTSNQDRRLSQTVSLQSQDSCDSLRTVIITKDDRASSPSNSDLIRDPFLPVKNQDSGNVVPGTEELETPKRNIPNKPYESVFGPARERRISDPFLSKEGTQINSLQSFQLSQRTLGQPLTYSEKPLAEGEVRENLGSPVKLSHQPERGLSTIIEQKAEEFVRPTLLRSNTTKEREFARSEEFVKPSLPRSNTAKERDFISSDDLLSRLPTHRPLQRAKRLTPLLRSSTSPQITPVPSEKMDVLKRGERRRTITPSLRRAGSQLDSPNASTEHIIFGGGDYHPQQGKVMQKADLYESWGDKASEPKSPTRPPSIRRRQSMQIVDLEDRLEGLAAENTSLIQEKANVEKTLSESIQRHRQDTAIFTQEIEEKKALLTEKDSEITELRKKLEYYHTEVQRLSQANSSLNKTNTSLSTSYKFSYGALAGKYERKREQLATLSKEHSELQASFANVQATMENVIRDQLKEKDSELERLRDELTKAREEVRKLREQATTRQDNKYLDTKDLHHFSSSCQQLYSSLKIWCNQFSSFSLGKKCVHVHRLKDEAVRDRVEHVMLDDRGVRKMLKDENKRSEVFMAITMRMIWEHVFTRYLFGLEVDERKKLISLETTLAEVGLHEAVHQWRSTTLTLLSTRPAIKAKREVDAEEIVQTIYNLLNFLLPPPLQYRSLALESLRSLVQHSVQLAVEMRTQRAEYVMKRPPRPDYDDQGEVTNTVPFVASTMQNRGSEPASAQELEDEGATVKLILFPQVIRRGNEYGENYDAEVTVLPMQVLVNRPQLRSESRASNKSVSSVWREQHHGGVSRLTPITDSSPMETPKTTPEKARITAQSILPAIPEQTIRLVQEDVAASRGYPFPNIED